MPKADIAHVFIDTNIALHFRRADEVDWCGLTGARSVRLLIAPILLNELEEQKIHNQSQKLRKRADKYLRWLAQFVRQQISDQLRPNTHIEFISNEPAINFRSHGLSETVKDDRLIASAIEYQEKTKATVYVATDDVGLEVKLRARQVGVLILSESLRLPTEPDEIERELRRTKERLQKFEGRSPELDLTFDNGSKNLVIKLPHPPSEPSAPSLEEIKTKYNQLTDMELLSGRVLDGDLIHEYNDKIRKYYKDYQIYLEELLEFERYLARSLDVRLILSNSGSAPATDIDLYSESPEYIDVIFDDNRPQLPSVPEPPQKPSQFPDVGLGVIASLRQERDMFQAIERLQPPTFSEKEPFLDEESGQIRFGLETLKHHNTIKFDKFVLAFEREDDVCSFSLEYKISYAEMLKPKSGKLHIKLEE